MENPEEITLGERRDKPGADISVLVLAETRLPGPEYIAYIIWQEIWENKSGRHNEDLGPAGLWLACNYSINNVWASA